MAARRRRAAVDRPQRSAAAGVARGSPPGGGRPNRDAGVDVEEGAHRRSAARQGRPLHGRQRREVDVGEGGGRDPWPAVLTAATRQRAARWLAVLDEEPGSAGTRRCVVRRARRCS